jgi:hypothetical protein
VSRLGSVTYNAGPLTAEDNEVLFCNEAPRFEAQYVEVQGANEDEPQRVRLVFLVLTPTNGYNKGKETRIPYERVVNIT